jgi:Protein of unknown function (DUF1838)
MTDPNDEAFLIGRRALMASGLALGTVAALPATAAATGAPTSRLLREDGIPADPALRSAIVRRMRHRTDSGMIFWWFRGRNYAQQGANLTPMCELIFGAMARVTPTADGGMDLLQYELGFRTAPDSGERAEKLRNPITGEMVEVPFAPVGPTRVHYSADNVVELPEQIGGSAFTAEHVPELFYRMGDQVCFQTHTRARSIVPNVADRVLNDMSMICSPAREALNPRVKFASAWAHGSDVTDYARWWKMPPGLGSQTLRSVGEKVRRFEDMPRDWIAMVAKADPAMAADPLSVLDRAQAKYRN